MVRERRQRAQFAHVEHFVEEEVHERIGDERVHGVGIFVARYGVDALVLSISLDKLSA